MKLGKYWRIIGLMLILLLCVSLPVSAESAKNSGKGYLEFKATVPSWVQNDVTVNLRHENGSTEQVILYFDEQYENIVKLPAGKYTVEYVEIVGVPTRDYLAEFAHNLVIEKDKATAYGIRVLGRGVYAEENDGIGTPIKNSSDETEKQEGSQGTTGSNGKADTEGLDEEIDEESEEIDKELDEEIDKETASQENEDDSKEEVRRNLLGQPVGEDVKKPSNDISGFLNKVGKGKVIEEIEKFEGEQANEENKDNKDNKDNGKKKESWGMRFLKRNWFTFLLLIVVCVATFIVKKKNDTL